MTNTILISMPEELVIAIDARTGSRGRSAFIRRACQKALKLDVDDDNSGVPLAVDSDDYEPKPKLQPIVEKARLRRVECINDFKTYSEKRCGPLAGGECVASGGVCPYRTSEQP
jgi:hypothetical protein